MTTETPIRRGTARRLGLYRPFDRRLAGWLNQHGTFDSRTGEWQWETDPLHYSSCSDLFPAADRMEAS